MTSKKIPPDMKILLALQKKLMSYKDKYPIKTKKRTDNNKLMARARICIEHVLRGVKRFGYASQIYRNHKGLDDLLMAICSGL